MTRGNSPRHSELVVMDKSLEPLQHNEKTDLGAFEDEAKHKYGLKFVSLTVGLMAVVLILAMDNYIIGAKLISEATAVPKLATDFNDLSLVGWYGSSYFLTLMSFQPAFGQLCTLFPIKTVYLSSVVVFEIGSVISASAPTAEAFIVGRLVSGAAGGGLWCGTLTLMAFAVPASRRHLYVSVVTSMYGVSSAAGPLLGGIFTDSPRLTWRFCFWVNLPIGFIAFVLIVLSLKAPEPPSFVAALTLKERLARIDILGAFLLLGGFVCLLLALQWGGTTFPWSDSHVWGCLLGFALSIGAFVWLQYKLKDNVRETSARRSGIDTLPYLMALLISPMLSGVMITMAGYYVPFMLAGCSLMSIGSGLLFTLTPDSSEGQWIGYQFLAAFGAGLCRQIAFSAVPLVLPSDDLATASALVALCNSLGPTLAIGLGQSILTNQLTRGLVHIAGLNVGQAINQGATKLSDVVPEQYLDSARAAFNRALTRVFVLSIASAPLAFICSSCMEWINVKKPKEKAEVRD
ncbi:MAG: hypothetical protein Q9207_004779 [Kuettlingeria erythrocarpa]